MDYQTALSKISIFSNLNSDELQRIAEVTADRTYAANDVIFVEHTDGNELFMILAGEVSIQLELANEDDAMPLLTLQEGNVFGELSIVDNAPRSATARAVTDTTVLVLKKTDFDAVMEADHTLGYKVMRNIAELVSRRVRATNQKILDNVSWGMI